MQKHIRADSFHICTDEQMDSLGGCKLISPTASRVLPVSLCKHHKVGGLRLGKMQRFHRKNCSNGNSHKDKASLQISGQILLSWRPKPRLSPPICHASISCISFFRDSCFHSPLQTDQVRYKGQRSDTEAIRITQTWFLQTFKYGVKNNTIWVPCFLHVGHV